MTTVPIDELLLIIAEQTVELRVLRQQLQGVQAAYTELRQQLEAKDSDAGLSPA